MNPVEQARIISVAQMAAIEAAYVSQGGDIADLMERAGRAVANEIVKRHAPAPTLVLCGPGNNGGDGYVVARHLRARGFPVTVAQWGDPANLPEPARAMAALWRGEVDTLDSTTCPEPRPIVVDALLGSGLNRPPPPWLPACLHFYSHNRHFVVAIDVPSGLHGDRAKFLDQHTWNAALTVTFQRKRSAHVLMPGRAHCGETVVADIGLESVTGIAAWEHFKTGIDDFPGHMAPFENVPVLHRWPKWKPAGHKYDRGHVLAVSGPAHQTGAIRLVARAALRAGAGLVTVAAPADALPVVCAHQTAVMAEPFTDAASLAGLMGQRRRTVAIIGPGNGATEETRHNVEALLATRTRVVLDADALTAFAECPDRLFNGINPNGARRWSNVMTPHEGEFERLFPGLLGRAVNKAAAAVEAAYEADAVIVLKGADTVVATPREVFAYISTDAPADLATAGSGDVLAGIIGGLMAQDLSTDQAAVLGVWLHAAAARHVGAGLIAEDLIEALPHVLQASRRLAP